MNINRFCSFSTQRVIFSVVFCFLPISLSIGVLWNHLDSLSLFTGFYLILTKCGLLLVEITAIFCLLWESAKDKVLSTYCFFANILIVFMMLLHVGSVFQYDSGMVKLKSEKTEYTNAASELLELNNKLSIAQNTALLETIKGENNNNANRKALEAVVSKTNESTANLVSKTLESINTNEKVNKNNIKTLLPIEYIESGAMYIVPILISFFIGIGALFISKTSIDMSNNGTVSYVNRTIIPETTTNITPISVNSGSNSVLNDVILDSGPDSSVNGESEYLEDNTDVDPDVVPQPTSNTLDRNALLNKLRTS